MRKTGEINQSLAARTRWLFTKDGLPVLASILVGIVLGFFVSGVVGLILATLAGFGVLFLFKRPPFRTKPWQALTIDLAPVVGKLFFAMAFLLPIADYLMLPDQIHNPNTLPKYLSIVIALPKNLFISPKGGDLFPGFAFIVIISIVLMYWGSMNLEKRGHLLMAFAGLVLYTISPLITATLVGASGIHLIMSFFGIGYYFAWVGLLLILASKFLPSILKPGAFPAIKAGGMLSFLPPVIALGLASHLNAAGGGFHFPPLQLFDFESTHHFVAGVFSAGVAATSSGIIVGQANKDAEPYSEDSVVPTETESGEIGPPPEEPPDVPEGGSEIGPPPEEPPDVPEDSYPVGVPIPSDDPDDPPGTTYTNNSDGSITQTQPGGIIATKYTDGSIVATQPNGIKTTFYTDGTVYSEGPNGDSYTKYPDGTEKEWDPETGLKVTQPNGDVSITLIDGRTGGVKHLPDGGADITSPNGGTMHIRPGAPVEGSITSYDGYVYSGDGKGNFSINSPYGGAVNMDKDGNMSGDITDEKGNKFTFKSDGSYQAKTPEGDDIDIGPEGIKAKFHDGSFINTDADGNPTSAHLKGEDGSTLDLNTDEKGNLHIKDDQGNSADMNQDGSGQVKSANGSYVNVGKDGGINGHLKDEEGTLDINTDGKGGMHIKDDKGGSADINQDGSGRVQDHEGDVATLDSNGNATISDTKGHTWGAKNDGSGYVKDNKGNRIDLNKNGSITTTEAGGKVTNYTADEVQQMKAQAAGQGQAGFGVDSSAGGG